MTYRFLGEEPLEGLGDGDRCGDLGEFWGALGLWGDQESRGL